MTAPQPPENTNDNIAVDVKSVTKKFGTFIALDSVSIAVRDNEFFTLLGPSGCGKTTLLRTIAGFESATSGSILLYGENIAALPPNKRPVNTVFQHYALFPHMNVAQNVMFGLQRLGMKDTQAQQRTNDMLELVQLSAFSDRLPGQLSGGQQQRVALARAIAPNPKVLLLDEPLSALDLKLRQAVRVELQQIQQETGITFIFVTHDQEEALTMSNRIAVFNEGRLQQTGNPAEIYNSPENRFVADFIGQTNLVDVTVHEIVGSVASCTLFNGVSFKCAAAVGATTGPGHISIRPERVRVVATTTESATDTTNSGLVSGTVSRHTYLGTDMHVEVSLPDNSIISVRLQNSDDVYIPEAGAVVELQFEASGARLLSD